MSKIIMSDEDIGASRRADMAVLRQAKEALLLFDNWLPPAPERRLGSLLTRTRVIQEIRAAIQAINERLLTE